MRITDLLNEGGIDLRVFATSKEEVLKKAVDLMEKQGNVTDKEKYLKAVYDREEEGTTGVGDGIAIPHGRSDGIRRPGLIAMVIPEGVEYQALDNEPVKLLFLIAADTQSGKEHMDILSKLSGMLMHDEFTDALKKAKTPKEFLQVIDRAEEERDAEKAPRQTPIEQGSQKRIVAVTGCPTGIAHTYMAAEAIEKSAKAMGHWIKVETRGSGGAKNVLTTEEIAQADGVIVAADTQVPMDRFHGKRVIVVPVSEGIRNAEQLIQRIVREEVPVYQADIDALQENREENANLGHHIYKHLMNGVSHMLPFVVGGGILIAIAFLIDSLSLTPQQLEMVGSDFGSVTNVAALFKGIGGYAFGFMLPILAGYIAISIADRPGLAVGIVGGYIAAQGSSGFLGALVAGFLAGYTVKFLMKLCGGLPDVLEGIKPVLIYPVIGILLIGLMMNFIIEPIVGVVNTMMNQGLASMNGISSVLLGLILAGMMAIDMGGPFNKAAYAFGIGAITAGNYNIMAAVMIGGMVPPCAIALATLLFKNKFTKEEQKNGPTNFVMGLSFITEGAIPYAAADPLRVIPSCVIGSGVAGALSMAFNCTLMAPHGGIFVFPVVGNAMMYVVALVIGTAVATCMLGLLKRRQS